jgi:hypothetical protein
MTPPELAEPDVEDPLLEPLAVPEPEPLAVPEVATLPLRFPLTVPEPAAEPDIAATPVEEVSPEPCPVPEVDPDIPAPAPVEAEEPDEVGVCGALLAQPAPMVTTRGRIQQGGREFRWAPR